jgi:hypothetical protein
MKRTKATQNRAIATRITALTSQGASPETIHRILESELPISLEKVRAIVNALKMVSIVSGLAATFLEDFTRD